MTDDLRALLQAAYLAGFMASAEGWNGEHPCIDYAQDEYWLKRRDEALAALRAKMAEGAK